jgi:4-amino-4-deoxy-L-arabinose transferase-like glycosyltransferase
LCLWERRAAWLHALRAAWGVPLMLAVVLPWFVAIGIATHGAFFAEAVGGDLGAKLAGGSETHGGFPGLHLLLLPLLAFPATFAVVAALPSAWAGRREAATRFLIAWVVPSWLVFEAAPTKLPHYTLPLYPALFLLASRIVPAAVPVWARRVGLAALVLAGLVIAGAALALPIVLRQAWWIGVPAAGCVVLVVGLAARERLAWALVASVALYGAVLQFELPALEPLWIAPRVERALRQDWPGWNQMGDGLAVAGYAEPSLMFLCGSHMRLLANGAQAAAALQDGSASLVIVTDREMPAFTHAADFPTHAVATVRGFNYSRGRWVTLSLLTR